MEKLSETKEKDSIDEDEQVEGNGDDEEVEEEIGAYDEAYADKEAIEQRVTVNNCDRA